ncbi:class II fumarate hydratase [Streptomyces sp. NPDC020125]|uniref:class II fumarate hydratase n=1 Tax=Streptomyces sp. NPDC020125 TaxID=3154593 RepID=UPI0033F1F6EA
MSTDKRMRGSGGVAVLRDPIRNRGTAFTEEERTQFGLTGLVPPGVLSEEQQAVRAYEQFMAQPTPLAQNTFLEALRDRNETLYYKLLVDHLPEMLPIVYDPVVGQAIEQYSHEYQRPRGVYLSVDDPGSVEAAFANLGLGADDVDLLVATDAEEILGIGDWGSNGMGISQGKLAVYTAAAGIDPARVIPVMLDVGTNNETLLNDPMYVGLRHSRNHAEAYDRLIDAYVTAASRRFPKALLHFEDFGPSNARRILLEYADRACVFNDDMQGTGAITLAAVLAGVRTAGTPLAEQRVVVFGAGTAGVGIADQIHDAMVRAGARKETAAQQIWLVDRQGLLLDDMKDLRDFQTPFARSAGEAKSYERDGEGRISLATTVAEVHPTILIGTSTAGGTFTEPIIRKMAAHVDRPLIFPLSNPTEKIEAHPADLIHWTEGRALIGTGTPWDPVSYQGVDYKIGQANNALVYPGLGLGTVVSRAKHVTPGMIRAAAEAVVGLVDTTTPGASLLPGVANLRASSATVAVAVVRQALDEGVARARIDDVVQSVQQAMWQPEYADHSDTGRGTTTAAERTTPTGTRIESDSMGRIEVPAEHYWGAQTQRSLIHFSIGDDHMPKAVYHAYGYVKKVAAMVNQRAGRLDERRAAAIIRAAEEVIAGDLDAEFPLYVWQTGSGTQSNMNVNEVIGNRASELLGGTLGSKHPVHPNDHVNMGQSSNDTFPTAMHIATVLEVTGHLLPQVDRLTQAIRTKAEAWVDVVKIGRTHLQDATPLTVGQEWSGWATQLDDARTRLADSLHAVHQLAAGGTAVGTGLNAPEGFGEQIAAQLAELVGHPFATAPNKFAAQGSLDAMVAVSAGLRGLAVALMKIANDMRWLASGPRAGLHELELPANEPGSSIMPGKVNPTQQEAMVMVCLQALGEDALIASAGAQGNFELNAMRPIIINNVLHSARILGDACEKLRRYSVEGTELDRPTIDGYVDQSLMLVTALSPTIGYDKASAIAHKADEEGTTLREAALASGVAAADFDRLADPSTMVGRPRSDLGLDLSDDKRSEDNRT